MSTKKQFVGVRCDVSKLDFLCKVTGLNRSQVINDLIESEFLSLSDDKKQEIYAEIKDLTKQIDKLQKLFND